MPRFFGAFRRKSPLLPPVFSRRYTSWISMDLSSALVMSYMVSAATDAAVSASISTPVCAAIFADAVMTIRSRVAGVSVVVDRVAEEQSGFRPVGGLRGVRA